MNIVFAKASVQRKEFPTKAIIYIFLLTALSISSQASEVIFIGAFGEEDYTAKIIKSALDHTELPGETTTFFTAPIASLEKMQSLVSSREDLLRIGFSANVEKIEKDPTLSQIHIPVMRGVAGYRVCFSHTGIAKPLEKAHTISSLKPYTFGVGNSWVDKDILNFNGLKTTEVGYYFLVNEQIDSLYNMTVLKRVDIFCRGINEVFREFNRHPAIKKLVLNTSFTLRYDMPFFFYVHQNNQALKQRLEKGINIIFDNGEFLRLWNEEFKESIDFVDMDKRMTIELQKENTVIPRESYQKYLYTPQSIKNTPNDIKNENPGH